MINKQSEFEKAMECVKMWLEDHGKHIGKLGQALLGAKKNPGITSDQYDQLEMFLKNHGMTDADLQAAKLVAQGKLDGHLFFAGVATSKILTLNDTDQKRLLSGEKFDLLAPDGSTTYQRSWGEMSNPEKDQLLGPKGGGIRRPHEQKVARSVTQKSYTVFEDVKYDNKALYLTYGQKTGEIQAGAIVAKLLERGELEEFIADLSTIQEQYSRQSA